MEVNPLPSCLPIIRLVTSCHNMDTIPFVSASPILYDITSGNTGGVFAVEETTGAIYVDGPLDYETKKKYELRLVASVDMKENHTMVVIHVKDVNDNPPLFERPTYRTQITEEDDRNLPKRVLQVSLLYSNNISLAGHVGGGRKKLGGKVAATCVAVKTGGCHGNVGRGGTGGFPGNVGRGGTEGYPGNFGTRGCPGNVRANDADKDRPLDIVYFLTGQGVDSDNPELSQFDINRTSGEIFVYKPLDRDLPNGRPQWRFTVFAQDEGGEGLVGYADVQVNLKDINDNAPVFLHGTYFGNVTENGTAGMAVMTMNAIDYDDINEGTNAKLIYSIEKNVIEEETGSPIFEIEPQTGIIKTAVCCLDRERTPDYSIQVVAMDGGGLKRNTPKLFTLKRIIGTGTASIRVKDINDMPPQFTKEEWFTEIDETEGITLPETPILTVTVHDEDETNKFQYKVIEDSGFGADKFTMSGGFRFRIQVNDKGDDSDSDGYHVAYSWVVVKLRDINDNEPQFERPNVEVAVNEDAQVGESLETFRATDPDQKGKSKVKYSIDRTSDRKRHFYIDQNGTVSVQRSLDREEYLKHQVKVLAIDDGVPSKTATALLTVIVEDINDNAPTFLEDYHPVLLEHVPPRKVVEILATDVDDRNKGNGPPFIFSLDPTADDIIKASFKVENDHRGASGDGKAVVFSLYSFDRELQKEYLLPIVIKDSGSPTMSSTSTLTVVIGDVNDNKMRPGSKDIFVYNYMGQAQDSQIGRVFVYDVDDWDLPDKTFYWEGAEHPRFKLNEESGMITMKHGTKDGRYHLRFKVYDRKQSQTDVPANVTVTVRALPHEAIINSGSIRIAGLTDEDLSSSQQESKINRLRGKLADILNTEQEDVEMFSVQLRQKHPPVTDVRFTVNRSRYYKPVRLNGLVLMHREENLFKMSTFQIEKDVGINITMIGIDECLYENHKCEGSCTNTMNISNSPYLVDGNTTSLVGVRVDVMAECTCGARNFTKSESCRTSPCYNGGRCIEGQYGRSCSCSSGYDGSRCQQRARSFRGDGWAWYPHLDMCSYSHLSFEFITAKSEGMLIYNGPIVPPETDEVLVSDFLSIELEKGMPRLLIDFGSGTLELRVQTRKGLDDGSWHRVDVYWDTENVRLVVDQCQSAYVTEFDDGSPARFDDASCQAHGTVPPFNEYLNVNTPLQIGGLYVENLDPTHFHWKFMPFGKGFDGCIKNVFHNSKVSRYGSAVTLQLDGGEGWRYNETFLFEGHQWLVVDKQEGVFAGGKAEYTGVRTFEVHADYQKATFSRLSGRHQAGRQTPLPPAMNGTQWGQATMARNLQRNCPSNKPSVVRDSPCPPTGRAARIRTNVWINRSLNGGTCINQDPRHRYRCICPGGFWGDNCELVQEGQTLKLGVGALAAILTCLLTILILLLLSVACNRRREPHTKHPPPNDDIRENIINYADEGGGEDDMTAFDIKPLQIPVEGNSHDLPPKIQCKLNCLIELYSNYSVPVSMSCPVTSNYSVPVSMSCPVTSNYSVPVSMSCPVTSNYSVPVSMSCPVTSNYSVPVSMSCPVTSYYSVPVAMSCRYIQLDITRVVGPHLKPGPVVEEFMEKYKRADSDINIPPFDDLRNYAYEGPGSVAGSLSSLPSGKHLMAIMTIIFVVPGRLEYVPVYPRSSLYVGGPRTDDNDQTFDYLEGWGPRFHKLDNIYRQDSEESGEDNSGKR
uniref:Uncharacterized protein n=1 Tax=Timema cristinae TaxID=61476 RepID=A0A7R9GZN8_TIMCR|nr:unnamed protein product [Timema cristinae]